MYQNLISRISTTINISKNWKYPSWSCCFNRTKNYLYKVKTIQNVRQCLETPALLLIHYSCWKIKESPRIGYNVTVPKTSSTENCGICLHEMKDAPHVFNLLRCTTTNASNQCISYNSHHTLYEGSVYNDKHSL